MSGDTSLAPTAAWDDGAQTWLRFAPGQDLPAIYVVDADGQEVIVNRHMEDEQTVVLHRVAKRWHLRVGNQVLAVHNDGPPVARSLATGTVSPHVERVIREETAP
ncbi:Type IV secretion system protein virB9 precursor [compost metagenome]